MTDTQTHWIDVYGGRLYVQTAGTGTPIVLLHGWALDGRIFTHQLAALSQQFQVIVPDRRGFGRSQAAPDLNAEVDDISRLYAHFDIDRAHLLGMSQGGRIAIRFAVTHPDKLRSLVLQAPAVDGIEVEESDEHRIPLERYALLARTHELQKLRTQWLKHPMMQLEPSDTDGRRLLERILDDYTGADLVESPSAPDLLTQDVPAALSNLEVETLVISGALDTNGRRQYAREIISRISGATEVVLDRSGHLGNLTQPQLYNETVANFCLRSEPVSLAQNQVGSS